MKNVYHKTRFFEYGQKKLNQNSGDIHLQDGSVTLPVPGDHKRVLAVGNGLIMKKITMDETEERGMSNTAQNVYPRFN